VITDGLHYQKFTDVPFTGRVTGKTQGSFRNGKKHGPWVKYHDNGGVDSKGTFKDGKKDGSWVYYTESGELKEKGAYKDPIKRRFRRQELGGG
jgi:antitoxin component YwqK of YwqJK toxin-antitoxin module